MVDMEGTIAVKTFAPNKIEFYKEIGSGSFGKVYKAVLKDSKTNIAVKVLYQKFVGILPNVDSKLRASAFDELAKLAVLDHANIVRLLGMVEDDIPWLIFEFMKDGNLLEYVMRKREIKEKTLLRFCRDICNGMAFLHRNKFLHKDLAARNVLLDGKVAKIADMGLCSFLTEEHQGSYALGGKLFPYRHAAAECIVECIFTFESDVWSFGVLLFEIFSAGAVPYGAENKQPEVRRFIADGMNPINFMEPNCSDEIYAIMQSIFITKRENRPSFPELWQYFEDLLTGATIRIPRPKDVTRTIYHQRVNDLASSSDRLSTFSTSPTSNFLGTGISEKMPNISRNSHSTSNINDVGSKGSNPNLVRSQAIPISHNHHQAGTQLLGISPQTSYAERRSSETPGLSRSRSGSRQDFLTVHNASPEVKQSLASPRRATSFNNVSNLDDQNSKIDRDLLKDYVPNRFGGNKK